MRTLDKGETMTQYEPVSGEILLVHDGTYILAQHGPGSITGSGNEDSVFVVGTQEEIDGEIARLELEELSEQ